MNWKSETPAWCNATTQKPYLLKMDQACLRLHFQNDFSNTSEMVELFGQSANCLECPLWRFSSVKLNNTAHITVNTTYPTILSIQDGSRCICSYTYQFQEFGVYGWNVTSTHCSEMVVETPPANIYLPLLWGALVVIILLIAWGFKCALRDKTVCGCLRRCFSTGNSDEAESLVHSDTTLSQSSNTPIRNRIRSLDTFRGITIALMILVNYGGGGYWFLRHAPWNGLTVADTIFPWFVWIMGASCVLSLNSQLRRALSKGHIMTKLLRRSAILILLGLVLNSIGSNNIFTLRIPGVLQRLGFTYIIVAVLELLFLDPEDNDRYAWYSSIRDIVCSWRQWTAVFILVAINLSVTFLLQVPGCPLGYLGAGGIERGAKYWNCTGGSARLVDVIVFGENHIHQRPTAKSVYDTSVAFDPEGILGSFTCILCAYLGVEAGKVLLAFKANEGRIIRWISWAVFTGLIGGALCAFSTNGGLVPINKNLWSLSYVLVTSSLAFCAFTLLYVFVDVLGWWSGAPFRYAGMNALLLYVGHILAKPLLPFTWSPINSTHAEHFAMNVSATAIWILLSWLLYRNRFFLHI